MVSLCTCIGHKGPCPLCGVALSGKQADQHHLHFTCCCRCWDAARQTSLAAQLQPCCIEGGPACPASFSGAAQKYELISALLMPVPFITERLRLKSATCTAVSCQAQPADTMYPPTCLPLGASYTFSLADDRLPPLQHHCCLLVLCTALV